MRRDHFCGCVIGHKWSLRIQSRPRYPRVDESHEGRGAEEAGWEGPGADGEILGIVKVGAFAGVAGPVAFTAAGIAGSLRPPGHGGGSVQLSGPPSAGARGPWFLIARVPRP